SALAPSLREEFWIEEFRLAIAQGRAVEQGDAAAGRFDDRLAGCCVPFHGRAEAWIEISRSFGDEAEFRRAAADAFAGSRELGDIGGEFVLVAVRAAMDDDCAGGRYRARRDHDRRRILLLPSRGAG